MGGCVLVDSHMIGLSFRSGLLLPMSWILIIIVIGISNLMFNMVSKNSKTKGLHSHFCCLLMHVYLPTFYLLGTCESFWLLYFLVTSAYLNLRYITYVSDNMVVYYLYIHVLLWIPVIRRLWNSLFTSWKLSLVCIAKLTCFF